MNKEYWYIENEEQIGPFDLNEFLAKKLSDETIVWFDGLTDWTAFKNVKSQLTKPNETMPSKKRNKKPIFISFLITTFCALVVGGYLIYDKYSFNEEDAKNAVVKFYEMIRSGHNNVDDKLYPDYDKIGSVLIIKKNYKIKDVIKNDAGEYEIFTEYLHNVKEPTPISFIVHKVNGEIKIKSSRGISYAFYDDSYEYGMRKRSFKGNETDAEIGKIDRKHHVSNEFKSLQDWELTRIKLGVQAKVSIQNSGYGLLNGSVSVFNGSDYDLEQIDFDCKVNYFDYDDNLIDSDPVYIFSGLKSGERYSNRIFPSSFSNFSQYSIEFTLNENENLKSKIRKWVIENSFK